MTIAVCCIAKDEEPYLDEWVDYHTALGFDHIHVYDNSDAGIELDPRHAAHVTVTHFPGRAQQMPAYAHFLATHGAAHSWAAFLDVDEFLVLKKHATVADLVRDCCSDPDCGALCLNWYMFGSAGEAGYRPEPVLQRFRWRCAAVNPHVKSIVRMGAAQAMRDPHAPALSPPFWARDTAGRRVRGPMNADGPVDVAVVHHYFVKSRGEWDLKRARGRADIGDVRGEAEFDQNDANDVHDSSALDFFSRVTPP